MIDIHGHAQALLDAMRATGVTVYDGLVPDGASPPYAVVYMDAGTRLPESMADDHEERVEFDVQVYSVGVDQRSYRWVASRVLSVAGKQLPVEGRSTIVRHVPLAVPQREAGNPLRPVFEGRDGLTIVSLKS